MNIKNFYKPSNRSFIESFLVMDVLANSKKIEDSGRKIWHFELGEPSPKTPKLVTEEAKKLIDMNLPGYTPSNGIFELRKSISDFYLKQHLLLDPDCIFVTTGSSGAFLLTFLSCFDPGDEVLIFNPSYPAYKNILNSLNIKVIEIESEPEKNFNIDIYKVKNYPNIKGLIISSPNNPNGQIFTKSELDYIYGFCSENNIILISDEIYHGIGNENAYNSLITYGEKCFIINSFSKYFCMPGWRLGWVIVPKNFRKNFLKLSQNLFISSNNIAQYSAIRAFECLDEFEENNKMYNMNREIVSDTLKSTPWNKFSRSNGGFYSYINISDFSQNSLEVVNKLLNDTGVALTPGIDFDKKNGNLAIRLSFSNKHSILKEGMIVLKNWINENY
tara:strand:- start:124 stop:1287 length:1164 start_codon:yes stop_codon:yes gene_type:complete